MESFEDIKACWEKNKDSGTQPDHLNKESVEKVIASRIKKEKKIIAEYFWASLAYQILIYAFISHLVIKYWSDTQLILLSLAGGLLYLPFTIIFMKKFKAMFRAAANKLNDPPENIQAHVRNQHAQLAAFFRFKRGFDWVGVPLSCFIIVVVIFKLYVPSGIEGNPIAGIITYLFFLTIFIIAIYFENRKRFKGPLGKLELVLEDMNKEQGNETGISG